MRSAPVIWVEGLIGAGKTTLAKILADVFGMRALFEPVDSNPYLELFYKDPKRWAFPMQMELLYRRYNMQQLAVREAVHGTGVILDRGLPGDRVFARLHMLAGNMSELEWNTYENAYEIMSCSLVAPSLLIFLDVEPDIALERVKARARGAEVGIDIDYLKSLRKGYLDLLGEIESGIHSWSRGMEVQRLSWNSDHLPTGPLIKSLSKRFTLKPIST